MKAIGSFSPPCRRVNFTLVLFVVLLFPFVARADGVAVRARETQGSFIVTIFTSTEISRDLPAGVSVLVQKRETGEIVMDATVDLSFTPPAGVTLSPNDALCGPANNVLSPGPNGVASQPTSIPAARSQAANKLFYGTAVVLRAVGDWQVLVTVRQGDEMVKVRCALPVAVPPRRLAGLWPYLALPAVMVALFAVNQWLRGRTVRTVAVVLREKSGQPVGR